ncbi:hypothetical protein LOAG_01242 [Loa loa]|uniref:BPTI/Kunitz inhibitor domain-containing protein n=2 Tax=Loa loa TaxID=7209 RepID=A0A1S0U9N0_LOALO|nr:hypothetical protein LOAG_01242 [Loa loa]EFO27239.2 hypothetical protein LOAG_01242 [Loa loa]
MHIYNSGLEIMLKSTIILILIKWIGGQEMLENTRCNHYPNRGTCEDRGFTTKWYYDRYAHRCREFHYGGCEGNENRFDSFEECSQACRYEPLDDPRRRCVQPHDPGTCAGNFERWYFDMQIRQCVCSWWSGCGGNSNMFYSYTHCMSVCGIYADNRTSETKMTFRRFIPESKSSHYVNDFLKLLLNEAMSSGEGRQYSNLFASSQADNDKGLERKQHSRPLPGKRMRTMNVRNSQDRGAQLARRYRYLLKYNPSQHWRMISNRFKQEPGQGYSTRMIVRKRGRVSETSDGVQMTQEYREKVRTNEAQDYGQTGQSGGQTSYSRPREVPGGSQVMPQTDSFGTAATPSPEHLHTKHMETYIQQMQAYENARAEALRERERLIQQRRRDEYERAVMYERELQRYQQAVQSAQNRVPKERIVDTDVWRQQQRVSPQEQYLASRQDQTVTFFNGSLPANLMTSEEIRRAKLKHRKLLNFEKLKQIEKNRKILKTTPKPLQQLWWMQDQQQQSQTQSEETVQKQQQLQRQSWSNQPEQSERDSQGNQLSPEYGRELSYSTESEHQQHTQYSQTPSDSYQVQAQDQQKVTTDNGSSMSVANEASGKVSQFDDRSSFEERFPFEMVVAADRVPDHQDAHIEETVSARPSSTEDFDEEKQLVTIEDYEDENYAYDQQAENGDQGSTFPEHTPAELVEGQWTLKIAVQPTFPSSVISRPTDLSINMQEIVTATAEAVEKQKESKTETDVI